MEKPIKKKTPFLTNRRRQSLFGIAYITPGMLVIIAFCIVPIIMTVYYSFTSFNLAKDPVFIGFENYRLIFTNPQFAEAFKNTGIYVLITVPVQTIVSLLAAAFLAEFLKNRLGMALRSIIFVPLLVSYISAAEVWRTMLQTNGGILNEFIGLFGIEPVNWLGSKTTALICVSLVAVWKSAGYFTIIFYAGIMNISTDVKEAAIIDGASTRQRFFWITIPIIKPITYMVVTLGIIWSFQAFDLVYQMTGGGPNFSTTMLAYIVYTFAFNEHRIGYASALAIILLVIILIIHFVEKKFFGDD